MSSSDEPDDAGAAASSPADHPIGPAARDALLRAIGRKLGPDALAEVAIAVPPEPELGGRLNLLDARVGDEGLPNDVAAAVARIRADQTEAPITWLGPDERVAIVSAAHTSDWLIEAARLGRGLDDLAALAIEGRSDVGLLQLARLLTPD